MSSDRRVQATLDVKSGGDVKATAQDIRGINEGLQNIERSAANAGNSMSKLQIAGEERFSEVSRQVALAGDVETNLRTVGGAIGTLGGEAGRAAEGVIALGAELPALVEAGPRLVTSLQGFPAAMSAGAAAISGMSVSIGGLTLAAGPLVAIGAAVAGGLAVLGSALQGLKSDAEEAARAIDVQRDANKSYAVALGQTSDEITSQIEANNERLRQIDIEKSFDEAVIESEKSNLIWNKLGDAAGITGQAGDQASESLKGLSDEEERLVAENERLQEALGTSEVAANDAATASEKVADVQQDTADAITSELVPAQEQQIQTTEQLAAKTDELAKKQAEASKKVAEAENTEIAARNALVHASNQSAQKQNELAQEQLKKTEEYNRETIKIEQDARDKLKKDRESAIRDQSFLRLFDIEADFESERQKREQERMQGLAELQQTLAEERAVKQEALKAEAQDEWDALFEAINAKQEAQREERKLLQDAERDKTQIVNDRIRNEINAYEQLGNYTSQLFGQITQMAGQSTSQLSSIFSKLDGMLGSAGGAGAGGNSIINNFAGGGLSKGQQRAIERMTGF